MRRMSANANRCLLGGVAILLFAAANANADQSAASCSQVDVQAAVDRAASGERVLVPAGTCTWSAAVTIPDTRGIELIGAGRGSTVIVDQVSGDGVVSLNVKGSVPSRVSGFTIRSNVVKSGTTGAIVVEATGTGSNVFRIDNNEILGLRTSRGIVVRMNGYETSGVIDHNVIEAPDDRSVQGVTILGAGPGSGAPFDRALEFGSDKFIFVEDNIFDYSYPNDGALDAYGGARYVFRHNTLHNTFFGHHGADSGGYRGIHSFEIYGNEFAMESGSFPWMMRYRSGQGLVWNNSAVGNYGGSIYISVYRSTGSYGQWGQCDGTSQWDGNEPGKSGWPCLDAPGSLFSSTRGGGRIATPLYAWGNRLNHNDVGVSRYASNTAEIHMRENRDFYNAVEAFDGSAGVGVGSVSQRPAGCSPNVGYWASDEQVLYNCTSSGQWSPFYEPYTYPHPLTGAETDTVPPNVTLTILPETLGP